MIPHVVVQISHAALLVNEGVSILAELSVDSVYSRQRTMIKNGTGSQSRSINIALD